MKMLDDVKYVLEVLHSDLYKKWISKTVMIEELVQGNTHKVFMNEITKSFKLAGVSTADGYIELADGTRIDLDEIIVKSDLFGVIAKKYAELILSADFDVEFEKNEENEEVREMLNELLTKNKRQIQKLILQQAISGEAFLKMNYDSGKFIVKKSKECAVIPLKDDSDSPFCFMFSYPVVQKSEFEDYLLVAELHFADRIETVSFKTQYNNQIKSLVDWDSELLGKQPVIVKTDIPFEHVALASGDPAMFGYLGESDFSNGAIGHLKDIVSHETLLQVALSKYIFPILKTDVEPELYEELDEIGDMKTFSTTFRDKAVYTEEGKIEYITFNADFDHNQKVIKQRRMDLFKSLSVSEAILGDFSQINELSGVSLDKIFYTTKAKIKTKWLSLEPAIVKMLNNYLSYIGETVRVKDILRENDILISKLEKYELETIDLNNQKLQLEIDDIKTNGFSNENDKLGNLATTDVMINES